MDSYTLTKNDLQDINILINLGESIIETEYKLIDLEIKGDKLSETFKITVESLKSTLALEANIYERIGTNPSKLMAFISYLSSNISSIIEIETQINAIIKGDKRNLIINRIINRLSNTLILENPQKINEKSDLLILNKNTQEISQIPSFNLVSMNLQILKDIVNTIIAILNIELNELKHSKTTIALLTKIKYYFSFIYQFVEKDLINNYFVINSQLYWTSKTYADLYNIQEDLYYTTINSYARDIVMPSLDFLSNMEPSSETIALGTVYAILMRAGLQFTDNQIIEKIKETARSNINMKKILKYSNFKNDEFILATTLKTEEDRKFAQIITLILKRES